MALIITDTAVDAWRRWFPGDARAGIAATLRQQSHTTRRPDGTQIIKTPVCKLVTDCPGGVLRVVGVKRLRGDKGDISAQRAGRALRAHQRRDR